MDSTSGIAEVKTYREIIDETAAAYTSLTRAGDGGECYYIAPDTGNMCAIGRCCEAPSSDWVGKWTQLHLTRRSPKLEPHERELLLKPEYRGKDPYFWMELQDLHDQPNNWTKSGLSKLGQQEVERLIERWGKRDEITECKGYHMESVYGYGYDPRRPDLFSPDYESCTEQELANHKAALAEFERCLLEGCEFICPAGGSWGIGIYQYEVKDDQPHN